VRRRLARLSERDRRVLDRLFVLLLLVICELNVLLLDDREGPLVANLAVVAVMAGALLWRRTHPLAAMAAVLGGALVMSQVLTPPPDTFAFVALLISACYATGRYLDGLRAFAGFALGVGTVTAIALIHTPDDVIWPAVFFAALPWVVGRTLHNQTLLARELAEKAERAAHAREEEERQAIAAERSRIARELHDVLAHDLSVMVVQASGARRLVERRPERATGAAELIQRTGREALAELRHLFGPVRHGQGEELEGPVGIGCVEKLAARARAAGLSVRVHVEGERVDLPTGVDLTAYRVVQEALTNSLKHAGGGQASVTVSYQPDALLVSIEDDGAGVERDGLGALGGGHGLVGMRERVTLYGGALQAGSRNGRGFAVTARLPV
jgi:signal transduction histidine kinase